MEYDDSVASSSESGLHLSLATDSDRGYEVYRRHCVYSVWNLDPLEAVLGFLMMI
jgi:hypothetical protein